MNVSTRQSVTENGANESQEMNYESFLQRFEAEARAFDRGFKTALFIEQFKAGLLLKPGRRGQRLQ